MMKKVLVIGLDGGTLDLIKPWAEGKKLPTFRKLIKNGVWGRLESTTPPLTIPAWNSLTTGKNPGKIGVFGFMQKVKQGYDFKPYFFLRKRNKAIWDYLNDHGIRTYVLNVPSIHSPYQITGLMSLGWLYQNEEEITYPKNLKGELDKVVGGYEIDVVEEDMKKGVARDTLTDEEYDKKTAIITEKHSKAFKYLLKKKDWDFSFLVFVSPDRVQHRFWERKEVLLGHYKKIDTKIKELLDVIDDDANVMVVSDHGFCSSERIFCVNNWLIREGCLSYRPNISQLLKKIGARIARALLASQTITFLLSFFPSSLSSFLRWRVSSSVAFRDIRIDWNNTKAFCYSSDGRIYLNLKGSGHAGVDPRDYDQVRDTIIRKLKELKDPRTGKKVPIKVFKREEIYEGSFLDDAPDLVIQVDENIQQINTSVGVNDIFLEGKGGAHDINGIFIAYGPDIRNGKEIEGAKIYDIAPTILHMFGLPIPADMDGRVLDEIFLKNSELAKKRVVFYKKVGNETKRIRKMVKRLVKNFHAD